MEEKHFTIPTQTVTDMQADHMPALNLAYVGDTLYDLYVRTRLVTESNAASGKLQKIAVRKVCAQGQAHGLQAILESLTDEEKEIVRKGRNARPKAYPKHASAAEYHMATAMETLLGHLYLTGKLQRAWEIMEMIYQSDETGESHG